MNAGMHIKLHSVSRQNWVDILRTILLKSKICNHFYTVIGYWTAMRNILKKKNTGSCKDKRIDYCFHTLFLKIFNKTPV